MFILVRQTICSLLKKEKLRFSFHCARFVVPLQG